MVLVLFYIGITAMLLRIAPIFGALGWSVVVLWVLGMARLLWMNADALPPQVWLLVAVGAALFSGWPLIRALFRR